MELVVGVDHAYAVVAFVVDLGPVAAEEERHPSAVVPVVEEEHRPSAVDLVVEEEVALDSVPIVVGAVVAIVRWVDMDCSSVDLDERRSHGRRTGKERRARYRKHSVATVVGEAVVVAAIACWVDNGSAGDSSVVDIEVVEDDRSLVPVHIHLLDASLDNLVEELVEVAEEPSTAAVAAAVEALVVDSVEPSVEVVLVAVEEALPGPVVVVVVVVGAFVA